MKISFYKFILEGEGEAVAAYDRICYNTAKSNREEFGLDAFLLVVFLVAFIGFVKPFILHAVRKGQYKKTEYYKQTQNPYWRVQQDKGLFGEFWAYKCLKGLKGYKRYLFNLYIPKRNGETTEIDILLLHESGIYVLESKNYSGYILGTESQQFWTQTFLAGGRKPQKTQFYNPIFQNKGHLKWLQAFLADPALPFYSYIVFGNRCTLKDITLTGGGHRVLKRYALLHAIQENASKAGRLLPQDKIDALFEKLYPLTQLGEDQKIRHIMNIEQKKQEIAMQENNVRTRIADSGKTVCPRCGGKLVVRTAMKGSWQGKDFIGCSNFPECRYIVNL